MGRLRDMLIAARNAADEVSETSNVAETLLLELYEHGLKFSINFMGRDIPIVLKMELDKDEVKPEE